MRTKYHIIKNYQELDLLIEACTKIGYATVDFETNAQPLHTKLFKPTILSVTFQPGFGCSIPLNHPETKDYTDKGWRWQTALKRFGRKVIENPKITKGAWNAKFDFQIFMLYHIYYRGTLLDGMLAKYILNEERPHDLKEMVRRYIPEAADYESDKGFDKIPWDKKPLDPLCKYGCQDTDYTHRLIIFFEKKLIDCGLYSYYRNFTMCCSRVLQSVEFAGLYLDKDFNSKLLEEYKPKIDKAREICLSSTKVQKVEKTLNQARIDKYLEKLYQELDDLDENDPKDARKIATRRNKISNIKAGIFTTKTERELCRPINLGSPVDLPQLMYLHPKGFKFPIIKYIVDKKTKKDTDKPSTDEDTLKELRLKYKDPNNPKAVFLDNLLELRGLEKMYKTYILGWSEKVQDDSRLHGRYNIHGTDSQRFSSADPNMQQIPKTTVDPNIKKQLIAPEGQLYLVFDYSQAELRIMAHLSGDETYLNAFRNGEDPHLAIAAKKYGVSYAEALAIQDDDNHPDHKLWKIRRKQAKQLAFGLIYGIGPGLLAVKLSDPKAGIIVTKEEAKQQMDEYFQEHPKLQTFKAKQERFLRKHGYLVSLFGAKRRLPQIYSDDQQDVAYAIRLGLNFPCQSAASCMTAFGSVLLYWAMHQGIFPLMKEVATVHDAIYMNTDPRWINTWTVYNFWEILRNPSTKKYFGFQIKDVDMDMDFTIGRSMAEELPFIPGYDYHKMLDPNFSVEEYLEEHKKYKGIHIKDFPKHFGKQIKQYEKDFKKWHS